MHGQIMDNSSKSVIPDILKLNDNEHQTNDPESEWSIECLQQLHSHVKLLFNKSEYTMGYGRAFVTFFGQNLETFTVQMILHLDQLQQQLNREHFSTERSTAALSVITQQFQVFIDCKFTLEFDYDSWIMEKCFENHTGFEVDAFRDTLLQLMGKVKMHIVVRAQHEPMNDDKANVSRVQSCDGIVESGIKLDVGSDVTKGKDSETDKIDTTSCSETLITHVMDADFTSVKDQVSCDEVHVTDPHVMITNERQHTDQFKSSYDTNLLERTDSDTMSNSANMSHKGGESDQNAECEDESSSWFMSESFKSNDMVDKEVFNELSNKFLQLEKHCISLEIAMQQKEESFQMNQPCKNPELPEFREFFVINELKAQIEAKNLTINNLKNRISVMCDMCNEVNAKHANDVTATKTREQKMAELLLENETLKKS